MARRYLVVALVLLLASGGAAARERAPLVPPTARDLGRDVTMLADPSMEGRGPGTPGGERASREIARILGDAGLQPGGDASSFFQSFAFATGTRIAPSSGFDLRAPDASTLALDRDWRPHGGSLEGEVTHDVVFVGYGITSADGRWDDYRGVDVRGRIALALDGVPAAMPGLATNRLDKLIAARRAGAGALMIAGDALPALDDTGSHVGIVSGSLTRAAADRVLAPAGNTVAALEAEIATRRAPSSFTVPGRRAHVRVTLAQEPRHTVNVIGILPGRDPAVAHEAVVIGAHHDHLGMARGQIFHGADDNASGTAAVLGLARAFAAAGGAPRTLVFVLFGAEEMGLLGSAHYVKHPVHPLARTVAMVNLDMVGRLGDKPVMVGGADSGSTLRALVNEAGTATGVKVNVQPNPFTPSDHQSFYRAGVPVLFFNTGGHADYHRPSDTADKIDTEGMARVTAVATAIIERLGAAPPPTYVAVAPGSSRRERADRRGPSGGAFLGVATDGRARGDGVRLRQIVPGSAAEKAALRAGDVIVRLGGELMHGFEDLTRVLATKQPGDTVELVFLRDGQDRTTSTALGVRP